MLNGKHVTLRIPQPSDYQALREAELSDQLLSRWRYRGAVPSPKQWEVNFWAGVVAQYLIVETKAQDNHSTPLGLVSLYNANFQHGTAYLSAASFTTGSGAPMVLLGVAMFIDYVFDSFDMRKLYMETSEYNLQQFKSGVGSYFTIEGRLKNHSFVQGQYNDEYILAISKKEWQATGHAIAATERLPAD